jgi:hypothetical protein
MYHPSPLMIGTASPALESHCRRPLLNPQPPTMKEHTRQLRCVPRGPVGQPAVPPVRARITQGLPPSLAAKDQRVDLPSVPCPHVSECSDHHSPCASPHCETRRNRWSRLMPRAELRLPHRQVRLAIREKPWLSQPSPRASLRSDDCDIRINISTVSSVHARLECRADGKVQPHGPNT